MSGDQRSDPGAESHSEEIFAELAEIGPVSEAVAALARLHRQLAGSLLRTAGVYPGQEFLLWHLAREGECVQSDLVASQGVDPSTITKGLQRMEAQNLIERKKSTTDGRATVVSLTDEGRALCQQVGDIWQELERKTTAGLSDRQRKDALALLQNLVSNCADALHDGQD